MHGKGDRPIYIRAYYGCYDRLAYPLFFPRGETGWNHSIPYETPPQVAQEDTEDDIEREDLQCLDRSSDVHMEQNTDEVACNYPHAFNMFHILFTVCGDHQSIISLSMF